MKKKNKSGSATRHKAALECLWIVFNTTLQFAIYKTHNTHNLHSCTVAYFCKIGTYCWVQKCSYSMFCALEPLIYLHLCLFFNADLYSNVNLYLNVVHSAEFHCLNVAPALKMPSLPSHSSSQLCLPSPLTVFVFLYFFNFDQRQLCLLPSQTVSGDWKPVCFIISISI